jgi:hypothetical protein
MVTRLYRISTPGDTATEEKWKREWDKWKEQWPDPHEDTKQLLDRSNGHGGGDRWQSDQPPRNAPRCSNWKVADNEAAWIQIAADIWERASKTKKTMVVG